MLVIDPCLLQELHRRIYGMENASIVCAERLMRPLLHSRDNKQRCVPQATMADTPDVTYQVQRRRNEKACTQLEAPHT